MAAPRLCVVGKIPNIVFGGSVNMVSMSVLRKTCMPSSFFQRVRCMATVTNSFKHTDLEVEQSRTNREKPDPDKLVFGKHFSDHMLEIPWNSQSGWGKPKISPLHNFSFHPACKVFHYAVELFEGMKAYRGVDNKIRMFRPDCNMERMNNTAERAGLPRFDGNELINCMKRLIKLDEEWVPYSTSSTLYIRPTFIGVDESLGVAPSDDALLYVITGPVGPYYPTGFKPVTLLADPSFVRAFEGGCGAYKMGANYAGTIQTQMIAAKEHQCQQVLWLYGADHQITEVGTMNMFMFWKNEQGEKELVTPPLDQGIILPGVTRRSLLDLARSWGEFKVTERIFGMKDLIKGLNENRVLELFGAGTACVVCPIEKILYQDNWLEIPTMSEGAPMAMRFNKELTDIQFGRTPSDWAVPIE